MLVFWSMVLNIFRVRVFRTNVRLIFAQPEISVLGILIRRRHVDHKQVAGEESMMSIDPSRKDFTFTIGILFDDDLPNC